MNLTLFFTYGVSLQTWVQNGSLEREVALYKNLQSRGIKVSFVTYGNHQDLEYKNTLLGIDILCNYWNLPLRLYEWLLPLIHFHSLIKTDVIKTNQIKGAGVALRIAKIFRKLLVVRFGYLWSDFARRANNEKELHKAIKIESTVFTQAHQIILTTPAMRHAIVEQYSIDDKKITIIPNYVLTDMFCQQIEAPKQNQICAIGRLTEQKNFFSLIQACAGLSVELIIIGEGKLRNELIEEAKRLGVNLTIHNNLPHRQIPDLLQKSVMFVLVSYYEGHPKALLEAMACGVPVLASAVSGIQEEIEHAVNGWLCNTDKDSIRAGILHLLSHAELRQELGKNARTSISTKYSLENIANQEYALLKNLVGESV